MRSATKLAAMIVALLWIGCSQPGADSGAPAQEAMNAPVDHVAAMKQLADAYMAAYSAENAQAMADLHTDDAILFPPDAPAVNGKAAILEQFGRDFEQLASPTITIQPSASWGEGEFVYEEGTTTVRATLPDGKPMEEIAKYVVVARHQADGSWKLHRVIWNRNAPLPQ
jgi:uncharacterized protein (TIGR02246 family)